MSAAGPLSVQALEPGGVVLVVDDNPATRYSTARVLQAAGYTTREAVTGAQALALAQPSLVAVILDIHLPDTNGFDVCRTLRARPDMGSVPVIHLTASYMMDADKVRGLEGGADAYMTHPADPPLLVATINALVRARRAEQHQQRLEARFRAIYELAPTGIALVDANGFVTDANPALLGLLKRPQAAVVGCRLADFAPPGEAAAVDAHVAQGRLGVWRGEFELVAEDGTPVPLAWAMSPYAEAGVVLAIGVDISERVSLAQQREMLLEREQAARADAERIARVKGEFIAVLSHELRTPLNVILTWSQMLKRSTAHLERGLEVIERNARMQARLIADILDVSRLDMGKLRLELDLLDAAETVRGAVAALEEVAAQKSIAVELDIEELDTPLIADGARLQQIVWNLVNNAIKFSDRGGRVVVSLRRHGASAELSVRDHGRGISEDFLAHVFERFTQSDSASDRQHGGLGLGLSIVKHLAELHGGTVVAHSEGDGRGADFRVRLPLRGPAATPPSDGADSASMPLSGGGADLAGHEILVVEDDADAREIVMMILRDHGADVHEAADADAALNLLRHHEPDVVVSDIGLPGRDGYALVRALRNLEAQSPARRRARAIALTAFSRPQDRDLALQAGFDGHCAKPLKARDLIHAILGRRPDES